MGRDMPGKTVTMLLAAVLAATAGVAGATNAAAQDHATAARDGVATEQLVARLGDMRGTIKPAHRGLGDHDRRATRSVPTGPERRTALLPVLEPLQPFSGPLFVLVGEPVARPMPDRPVRVVYQGTILAGDGERW